MKYIWLILFSLASIKGISKDKFSLGLFASFNHHDFNMYSYGQLTWPNTNDISRFKSHLRYCMGFELNLPTKTRLSYFSKISLSNKGFVSKVNVYEYPDEIYYFKTNYNYLDLSIGLSYHFRKLQKTNFFISFGVSHSLALFGSLVSSKSDRNYITGENELKRITQDDLIKTQIDKELFLDKNLQSLQFSIGKEFIMSKNIHLKVSGVYNHAISLNTRQNPFSVFYARYSGLSFCILI
ncbi:MAG: outer membrane beta-barrel protein [Bacteroidia bacterium]